MRSVCMPRRLHRPRSLRTRRMRVRRWLGWARVPVRCAMPQLLLLARRVRGRRPMPMPDGLGRGRLLQAPLPVRARRRPLRYRRLCCCTPSSSGAARWVTAAAAATRVRHRQGSVHVLLGRTGRPGHARPWGLELGRMVRLLLWNGVPATVARYRGAAPKCDVRARASCGPALPPATPAACAATSQQAALADSGVLRRACVHFLSSCRFTLS